MADYQTFDWHALLAKFEGDEDFARALLGVALRSSGSLPTDLRNACVAADYPALARLAHKVKGTAGDLVAAGLLVCARDAELAAREADPASIDMNLALADALDALLAEVRTAAAGAG